MEFLLSKNRLGTEKSPYLLQHAQNPVWWFPWGDEAFEYARRENKPVFLSIGYATCYWCHVMEKDSFEIQEIADILNEKFIAIKLDREERPDIDAIYMDAVVGMTGHGGWPMSVFMTADRLPFWGGTFFYRAQFSQILERLHHLWSADRDKIYSSVDEISKYLRRKSSVSSLVVAPENDQETQIVDALTQNFDQHYGGFGTQPKFPPTGLIAFLARVKKGLTFKAACAMHDRTLEGMAKGGIFDQVGGGFARYSTDQKWLIPHFEKMLYDNALLTVNYADAWQLRKNPEYLEIVRATLDFIMRELKTEQGGFASALDAGDVGSEGEYYVWSQRELSQVLLADEFELVSRVFTVTAEGNFEAKHMVLAIAAGEPLAVRQDPVLQGALAKLLAVRSQRQRPLCDDKILTAWNGLALSAFASGYVTTRDERYANSAKAAAEFLVCTMLTEKVLYRRYREGDLRFDGCLEDYAYLAAGLIDLGLATEDYRWIEKARLVQQLQDQLLWDEEFSSYVSSRGSDLIVEKREFADGALPSANAVSLYNLHRLAALFVDLSLTERAVKLTQRFFAEAQRYPQEYCRFHVARKWGEENSQLIIVVPKGASLPPEIVDQISTGFRPTRMVLIINEGGNSPTLPILQAKKSLDEKVTAYLCDNRGCLAPDHDVMALLVDFEAGR